MIGDYAWARGREGMLRFGPVDTVTILILPPLFEEANRTRRVLVQTMRALSEGGLASVLPDLPGTGDSVVATVDARFDDWADAVRALAVTLPRPRLTFAVRGGCLLDGFADPDARYRLAPITGAQLLRDVLRSTAIGSKTQPAALDAQARLNPTRLAGNLVHPDLYVALDGATCDDVPARTAGVGEASSGDVTFTGTAPWRRAEPTEDATLSAALAGDIIGWAKTCVAR